MDFIELLKSYEFNVKVIIYFRSPVKFFSSMWAENIKNPSSNLPLNEYIPNIFDHMPYSIDTAFSFIKNLGIENVIIRPYEEEQRVNHDLIDDFMNIFQVEVDDKFLKFKPVNISFKRNTTEL